jgi:hypothetical protein
MGQDGRRDEERQEDLYAAFDALGGQDTPRTSWAITMPTRLTDTPPAAELAAVIVYGALDPAIAAPRPTISTTARSPHHQVERSARSFVHSARTTRTRVTGPAAVAGTGAIGAGPTRDGAHRVAPAWCAFLEVIVALAGIGTAVTLYPVVKRQPLASLKAA